MKGHRVPNGVVVGVDGSPEATEAARYAVGWAALHREPLILVYAYRPDRPQWYWSDRDGAPEVTGSRDAAETVVVDVLAQLHVAPTLQVEGRAELGSAGSVLE